MAVAAVGTNGGRQYRIGSSRTRGGRIGESKALAASNGTTNTHFLVRAFPAPVADFGGVLRVVDIANHDVIDYLLNCLVDLGLVMMSRVLLRHAWTYMFVLLLLPLACRALLQRCERVRDRDHGGSWGASRPSSECYSRRVPMNERSCTNVCVLPALSIRTYLLARQSLPKCFT
eukprot:COSAG05_NODE_1281_length_5287_cov_51.775636_2_plen_174_part_00